MYFWCFWTKSHFSFLFTFNQKVPVRFRFNLTRSYLYQRHSLTLTFTDKSDFKVTSNDDVDDKAFTSSVYLKTVL